MCSAGNACPESSKGQILRILPTRTSGRGTLCRPPPRSALSARKGMPPAWGRTAKTPCVQRILASGGQLTPGVRTSVCEPGSSGPAPSGVRGPATSARFRPAPSWLQIERRECAAAAVRAEPCGAGAPRGARRRGKGRVLASAVARGGGHHGARPLVAPTPGVA